MERPTGLSQSGWWKLREGWLVVGSKESIIEGKELSKVLVAVGSQSRVVNTTHLRSTNQSRQWSERESKISVGEVEQADHDYRKDRACYGVDADQYVCWKGQKKGL
jgi:hypothetical protein